MIYIPSGMFPSSTAMGLLFDFNSNNGIETFTFPVNWRMSTCS
ncbi:hypothetical protein [Flavobacterium hiemivividum]|nr:hypothetical protein [Flavobacterium hiemivividum]